MVCGPPLRFSNTVWKRKRGLHLLSQRHCEIQACVHLYECEWVAGSTLERKVTGWPRHVQDSLGPRCLSVPPLPHIYTHTHACTQTHRHTFLVWHTQSLLNYMSLWSVEFICNLLRSSLFSKSHDRSRIIFRPSLPTNVTDLPPPLFLPAFDSPHHPLMSLCVCQEQKNQTRKGLSCDASSTPDVALNRKEYEKYHENDAVAQPQQHWSKEKNRKGLTCSIPWNHCSDIRSYLFNYITVTIVFCLQYTPPWGTTSFFLSSI